MPQTTNPDNAEVFISYASADRPRVVPIADQLAAEGVSVWLDRNKIEGATFWAEEIVCGIKASKVVLLMCSDASMRSWAVKQEIQLAGERQKALLPVILNHCSFPEQIEFFLAGRHWIEVTERPAAEWMPPLLRSLARAGVRHNAPSAAPSAPSVEPQPLSWSLEGLRALARFTDQIWPIPAERIAPGATRSGLRGLGAPQDDVAHGYRLGSRGRLAIESEREGHLLLLDEGPEGILYCLCPSFFAPDTYLPCGRSIYPQARSRCDSFVLTGRPGREQLLAIVTAEPLDLGWMPADPRVPARVLDGRDVAELMNRLRDLGSEHWTALATWFDVIV
jgi:hypothetical protein